MKKLTEGIYFGSQAGVYNLLYVVELAVKLGYKLINADIRLLASQQKELTLPEEFIYLFEDCERYLSVICPLGFYFGSTEDGDYGVFAIDND